MGGQLTAIGAKALIKPGRYTDGQGLHLYVQSPTRRTWVLRYMVAGKSRDMGLGSFPAVSLAKAREKATAARALILDKKDPLDTRRTELAEEIIAEGRTFKAAAEELIKDKSKGWKNPKHRAQWAATLEAYAYPVFGDWPVQKIDSEAVMRVLRPIWDRVPETASRLRGRIEAVLDAARARGWRDGENPARWKGHLASRLPSARKVKVPEHQPSLPWQQLPAFLVELAKREGMSARATELAILTAARSGEVRGATWSEIDLAAATWTIPGKRMKAGKLHRVPLSTGAVAILKAAWTTETKPGDVVFPGPRTGKPLSDMSLTAILRRMNEVEEGQDRPWRDGVTGESITVHGFRSTFRVWAGEQTAYPREVVEAALAHSLKDRVEAAYARTDLVEKRRALMEEWGLFAVAGKADR